MTAQCFCARESALLFLGLCHLEDYDTLKYLDPTVLRSQGLSAASDRSPLLTTPHLIAGPSMGVTDCRVIVLFGTSTALTLENRVLLFL